MRLRAKAEVRPNGPHALTSHKADVGKGVRPIIILIKLQLPNAYSI
jgi:hypothetical protein